MHFAGPGFGEFFRTNSEYLWNAHGDTGHDAHWGYLKVGYHREHAPMGQVRLTSKAGGLIGPSGDAQHDMRLAGRSSLRTRIACRQILDRGFG